MNKVYSTIFLIALFAWGSAGGEDNLDTDSAVTPTSVDSLQVEWVGTADTKAFGLLQTVFNLTQDGNNIPEGTLRLTDESGTVATNNVTGSITNSTMTISAIFTTTYGSVVEFGFVGDVIGDTYSGNVNLFENGVDMFAGGPFSLTRQAATNIPEPTTEVTNQCYNEYAVCMYNCGSNPSCEINCAMQYDTCLKTGPTGPGTIKDNTCLINCENTYLTCTSNCLSILIIDDEDFIRRQQCYNDCDRAKYTCETACPP